MYLKLIRSLLNRFGHSHSPCIQTQGRSHRENSTRHFLGSDEWFWKLYFLPPCLFPRIDRLGFTGRFSAFVTPFVLCALYLTPLFRMQISRLAYLFKPPCVFQFGLCLCRFPLGLGVRCVKTFLTAINDAGTRRAKPLAAFRIGTGRRGRCVTFTLCGDTVVSAARENRRTALVERWIESRVAETACIVGGSHGKRGLRSVLP